ncbi:glycosyltransferase family A protein [Apibacter raozihei]|uniref:glycosyltransferase family 2 protein n=1 Tax=Apibacter raozihei TaxID=2500547 RepID=UPI000FE40AB3|nr:glycosyltransferase family A protein [Apibacter raozihei]
MTNSPFISIIVPCYNQAEYLDESLNSVLNQTFSNWECLIVDDGSPDNTQEIANLWCLKDDRFKYLKKQNGGLSSARNYGIKFAQGEWVLPLDADDKIADKYLELAYNKIKQDQDICIIYCKAKFFGTRNDDYILAQYSFVNLLLENMIFCSSFFKKSDFIEVGGYDINMKFGYEDWEFWINLLKNNKGIVLKLDYLGFYYRMKDGGSMIQDINKDEYKKNYSFRYIIKKHSELYLNNEKIPNIIQLNYENIFLKDNNLKLQKKIQLIENNFLYKILHRIYKFISG